MGRLENLKAYLRAKKFELSVNVQLNLKDANAKCRKRHRLDSCLDCGDYSFCSLSKYED